MKKRIIAIIIVAVVIIGTVSGVMVYRKKGHGGKAAGQGSEIYVMPLSEIMGANSSYSSDVFMGVVEGQETSSVTKSTEREIDKIFVSEGDEVSEGSPLFSYETESLSSENTQLGFDIERENLSIAENQRTIEKTRDEISKIKGESDEDKKKIEDLNTTIEDLETDIAISQNTIDQTNAKIEENNKKIGNSVVKAKVSGTVTKVADDTNPYTTDGSFITILASTEVRVKGMVNEQNIGSINVGEPVTLRSRIDSSMTWTGTIQDVNTNSADEKAGDASNGGASDESTSTKYPFHIALDSSEGLMLGQHLYVELGNTEAPELDFSSGTYIYGYYLAYDEKDKPFVWVDDDGILAKKPVKLGEYYEEQDVYEVSGIDNDTSIAYPMEDYTEGLKTIDGSSEGQ